MMPCEEFTNDQERTVLLLEKQHCWIHASNNHKNFSSFSELPNPWPLRVMSGRLPPSKLVLELRMIVKVMFLLHRKVVNVSGSTKTADMPSSQWRLTLEAGMLE
jgi:hypothetical protein